VESQQLGEEGSSASWLSDLNADIEKSLSGAPQAAAAFVSSRETKTMCK
jgi:hypothetical protein